MSRDIAAKLVQGAPVTALDVSTIAPLSAGEVDAVLRRAGCAPADEVNGQAWWRARDVYEHIFGHRHPSERTESAA